MFVSANWCHDAVQWGGCLQSDNMRALNFTGTYFNGGPPINYEDEVYIVVNDDDGAGAVMFEGIVPVGEAYSLYNDGNEFGDVQQIRISSPDNAVLLQEVRCSLTCSQPDEFMNRFGASQLVEYYNNEQGLIVGYLTFSYETMVVLRFMASVTNADESVMVTNITASSDLFDPTDISSAVFEHGDHADSQNSFQFVLEGPVETLARKSYSIDLSYEGKSTVGSETTDCEGAGSVSFTFGAIDVEGN